jgi:hypothetical protein
MKNIFTKHPHEIGESYFKHMLVAAICGSNLIMAGCACFIHALLPFVFQKTASNVLFEMVENFIKRTPTIEKRTLGLSKIIEEKAKRNQEPYPSC